MWLIQPYNIKATHSGIDSERVIVRCLDLVKMYGSNPSLLLNTIKENSVTKIIVLPTGELASKILNSLWSVSSTLNHSKDQRDGIIQYNAGINNKPKKVEIQFKDRFMIDDMGSKTENKFVIIFKLYY